MNWDHLQVALLVYILYLCVCMRQGLAILIQGIVDVARRKEKEVEAKQTKIFTGRKDPKRYPRH